MKYVTKYALTQGILTVEKYSITADGYLSARSPEKGQIFITPWEWFDTLEEARAESEKKRRRKMDALEKQLKKLATYEPAVVVYA